MKQTEPTRLISVKFTVRQIQKLEQLRMYSNVPISAMLRWSHEDYDKGLLHLRGVITRFNGPLASGRRFPAFVGNPSAIDSRIILDLWLNNTYFNMDQLRLRYEADLKRKRMDRYKKRRG